MSPEAQIPVNFPEWIVRSIDGTIAQEQFALLDHEVATNEKARAYYLEFVTTYVALVDLVGGLPRAETLMGAHSLPGTDESQTRWVVPPVVDYPAPKTPGSEDTSVPRVMPETSEEDRVRQIERYASRQLAEFLAQEHREQSTPRVATGGWDLWTAIDGAVQTTRRLAAAGARLAKVAAVCMFVLGILSIVGLYVYANRTLGILVESSDARWDVPIEQTGELRAGCRTLEQGYARIRLGKGAEVILQAPSTIDLRSTNRMFLESGWITAKVPPSARGFTVRSAASSVIDYGTEFGLLVGSAADSEIHVFDGGVEFEYGGRADAARTRRKVAEDEAVTVDAQGHGKLVPLNERPRLFVRTMPAAGGFAIPGKRLGLADMIGEGTGLDTGDMWRGIDPAGGQISFDQKILKGNDAGFVSMPALPFIDGVFVPDSNDGSAVVTSTGIEFAQCPITCGKCYETIINGARFRPGSTGEIQPGQLAGRTYDTKAHPSIGMHPNAGITFDLDAIRNAMPETQIERFTARCGVSENVVPFAQRDADPNAIEVTFWVLVDGRPRFSRTLKVVPAQSERIDVPIGPQERFLTLATTNPGEYRYCWAMFAEPALELARQEDAKVW
jgi:hypothetical protein